jgi:hypothetical protein
MQRHRFSLLFFAACLVCAGQSGPEVELITSDIDNFWRAYDASTPGNRVSAFQSLYFDVASPGLKDFITKRISSAQALASTVDRFPKYYASIRANTLRIAAKRDVMQLYFSRFRGLYPEAQFPPVYFLIGRLSTGGTVGNAGLYIGAEVFALGPDVDTSELQQFIPSFYKAMGTIEKLPLVVVHEAVHSQVRLQSRPNLPDLLTACVLEGAADFVTNLVAGRTINDYKSEWAEVHREEILQRYAQDLIQSPSNLDLWLYNYGSVTGDTPADLGYWIGEEISRDYYTRAGSKETAIQNILSLSNPEAIVRESSFASLIPQSGPETSAARGPNRRP